MLTAAMTSRSTRRVGSFGLLIPGADGVPGPSRRVCDHRRVIPIVLVLAGVVALAVGWLLLRRVGPGARIGRILAATPMVPVDRAVELARGGSLRYVGVGGRLDSASEFMDEDDRPLVFRRTRLELRGARGWTAVEDVREVVPFDIAGGLEQIAVDGDALDEGLIVVRRESLGVAGEIPDRLPEGTPPDTPARYGVELLSTVDHALVLGVPVIDAERGPIMRPGLGRPLILTTLEPAEAMRMLAVGRQGTVRAVTALMAAGAVAVVLGVAWGLVDAVI
jgi:hypothetical protein